jgi:hypothetical protein
MTNPIDVIANAIRVADGNHTMGAGQIAEVATAALTADRVIDNAVRALLDEAWEGHPDPLTVDDLRALATVVLRSVGGA